MWFTDAIKSSTTAWINYKQAIRCLGLTSKYELCPLVWKDIRSYFVQRYHTQLSLSVKVMLLHVRIALWIVPLARALLCWYLGSPRTTRTQKIITLKKERTWNSTNTVNTIQEPVRTSQSQRDIPGHDGHSSPVQCAQVDILKHRYGKVFSGLLQDSFHMSINFVTNISSRYPKTEDFPRTVYRAFNLRKLS